MNVLMDVLLFSFLVITAWGIIRLRDLFAAVMMASLLSLVAASLFTVLDAVDVAFTEAAVGAGMSTVLMLATLALTREREKRSKSLQWGPLVLCLGIGLAMAWGMADLPDFGDPTAPLHVYPSPSFIERAPEDVDVPNVVTAVLASYRGYDTFGETTVVFAAALGVLLLLSDRIRTGFSDTAPGSRGSSQEISSRLRALREQLQRAGDHHIPEMNNRILRLSVRPLIPAILLFGLYVQFHGDYGPGGGFQAGVIFASGIMLFGLVFGLRRTGEAFSPSILEASIALGVMLYGSVGVVAMARGGAFLDYDVLAHDPIHGQHLGILLIEAGVGLTVAAAMTALFLLFAARGLRRPSRER